MNVTITPEFPEDQRTTAATFPQVNMRIGEPPNIGPMRHFFGFSKSLCMEYAVPQQNPQRRDAAN